MVGKVQRGGLPSPELCQPAVTVELIEEKDIESLRSILETWIRDRETGKLILEEMAEVFQAMRDSLKGENDRAYFVAKSPAGEVLGVVGFKPPGEQMEEFVKTGHAVELVNAFVAREHRGRGVGRALVERLEEEARARGHKEIVLNSGPRYKDTGWGFYDRLEGYRRVGIAEKMYGEGGDAVAWRKILE